MAKKRRRMTAATKKKISLALKRYYRNH